jgi:hypothetical protein
MVINLPELVAMKLQAFRRIDQVHIEDLLAGGLITDDIIDGLPDGLKSRRWEIQNSLPD